MLRGGAYELHLRGLDELLLHHDSVMLEACTASFQIHLQVGAEEQYELGADSLPSLAHVLRAAVRGPQALAEVHRVLQLVTAFERELASPSVAAALIELLRADPDARLLVKTSSFLTSGCEAARRLTLRSLA